MFAARHPNITRCFGFVEKPPVIITELLICNLRQFMDGILHFLVTLPFISGVWGRKLRLSASEIQQLSLDIVRVYVFSIIFLIV